MITNDTHLQQAQADIQTIWRFLESARQTHAALDYQRLVVPYVLQLQERQQAVVAYLTQHTAPPTQHGKRMTWQSPCTH